MKVIHEITNGCSDYKCDNCGAEMQIDDDRRRLFHPEGKVSFFRFRGPAAECHYAGKYFLKPTIELTEQ